MTQKTTTAGDGLLQLVTFEVGGEQFGVDTLAVQEINRMMTITHVPQTPADVDGVINLRGRIVPVVDLRVRLGLQRTAHSRDSRIVVVEVADRTVGFIVDKVHEVMRIDGSVVEPAPQMVAGVASQYIDGVCKLEDRLIILLNLHRLFVDVEAPKLAPEAEAA